jgi:glycosyltransferase involved in cell wall biosynthesis
VRVALLNSEDLRGGAARAAYRLHLALRGIDVDARMLVQVKQGDSASVLGPAGDWRALAARLRPAADLLPLLAYPRRTGATFYPGWLPDRASRRVAALAPDLVHLHWITGGAVNVRSLRRFGRPLVWTLHDMWAFTGGCHYDDGCGRYADGCGGCPVLGSGSRLDLSRLGWRRKHKAYAGLPLNVVAPSRWLGELARNSPLLRVFPVTVIPNAIDTAVFRPLPRETARDLLGLPRDRRIVLFGALRATSELRKGYRHLEAALRALVPPPGAPVMAVVLGASAPAVAPDFGMDCRFLGTLSDDLSLALAYSAADVFVAPSTQENLSNAVVESLACGTPVVAFDVGGMPDMIEHQANGWLARPFDAQDLAAGITWVLGDEPRHRALRAQARQKAVAEYASETVARRHRALYQQILNGVPPPAAGERR